ncbi:MAG: choice-of-anchor Q domain-containing protein [Chloroflexota bacterium]
MNFTKIFAKALPLSLILTLLLLALMPAAPVLAATFDLTGSCPGGVGDVAALVAALNAANANGEADTLTLADNCVYTLTAIDNGDNGLPQVTSQITLDGNGSTIQRGSGAPAFRIFQVGDAGSLTLNDLTLQNGETNYGGGILNTGALTLNRTTIRNNTVNWFGGGLANLGGTVVANECSISGNTSGDGSAGAYNDDGPLSLTDCTISDNTAARDGAGIETYFDMTITDSTFSNNRANGDGSFGEGRGGGLWVEDGHVEIINSTFSGNFGETAGAIFYGVEPFDSSLTLTNVTLYNNSSGIFLAFGLEVSYRNSIIAGNTGYDCSGEDDPALFTSLGYNLLGSGGGCPGGGTGDQTTTDPRLAALADNGGPTRTHALLADSPALDAIPAANCAVSTDQRGVSRPQPAGGLCDVGAFELSDTEFPVVTGSDPSNGVTLTTGPSTITVNFSEDVKNDGSAGAANNPANYLLVRTGRTAFSTPRPAWAGWSRTTCGRRSARLPTPTTAGAVLTRPR